MARTVGTSEDCIFFRVEDGRAAVRDRSRPFVVNSKYK